MAYFQNDDLEYVVNDYYDDVVEFEEDNDAFADNQPRGSLEMEEDSDFEDDLDSVRALFLFQFPVHKLLNFCFLELNPQYGEWCLGIAEQGED